MGKFFSNLKQAVITWLAVKGVVWGFAQLSSHHLGQKLNMAMDASKFLGKTKSDTIQQELAKWLRELAKELEA